MTEVPLPAHRTRRDEQAERTRQRILDVALDLFAERGYGPTSLQDIADAMAVTKAAVYHHFHAKADILRALSASTLEAITAVADRVAGLPSQRARINAMIEGCLEVILSRRAGMRVLANDPAMRTDMTTARQFAALRARLPVALYGENPTPEQRFAVHAGLRLADEVIDLADLPEDEIRRILSDAIRRLITIRPR
jgi:AcrR family transcriptional regulator